MRGISDFQMWSGGDKALVRLGRDRRLAGGVRRHFAILVRSGE